MGERIKNIESLLRKVSVISKSDTEIKKAIGARYNMFQVLKVQRKELKHSLIIRDLLNPKGRHDQGDIYLKLFLEIVLKQFNIEEETEDSENHFKQSIEFENTKEILEKFDTEKTKVHIEHRIGTKKGVTGGQIDILLESKGEYIVIENKVDAVDQKYQLLRYKNFKKEDSVLLYLNKKGISPKNNPILTSTTAEYQKNKSSNKNDEGNYIHLAENKDFFIISFKKEITEWIEKCIQISIDKPYIRENLNQYLEVVKRITNQNSNEMNEKIVELLIETPGYIELAEQLKATLGSDEFYEYLNKKYGEKISTIFSNSIKGVNDLNGEFNFKNGKLEDNLKVISTYNIKKTGVVLYYKDKGLKYCELTLKFDGDIGFKDFRIDVRLKPFDNKYMNLEIWNKLNQKTGKFSIFQKDLEHGFKNWEEQETWSKVNNSSDLSLLEKRLNEIIKNCKEKESKL